MSPTTIGLAMGCLLRSVRAAPTPTRTGAELHRSGGHLTPHVSLAADGLQVGAVHLVPDGLVGLRWTGAAIDLGMQPFEAQVPAGSGPRRVASLSEHIEQHEPRSVAIGFQLHAQPVVAPLELEQPRRLRPRGTAPRSPPRGCSGRRRSAPSRREPGRPRSAGGTTGRGARVRSPPATPCRSGGRTDARTAASRCRPPPAAWPADLNAPPPSAAAAYSASSSFGWSTSGAADPESSRTCSRSRHTCHPGGRVGGDGRVFDDGRQP